MTLPHAQFSPDSFTGGDGTQLSALLGIDGGTGKLALIGGFAIVSMTEATIAPGVRAWRLVTALRAVPQCAALAILCGPAAPFAVPMVTNGPALPSGLIVVDVYLKDPAGPVDPAVILGPAPGGLVFLSVAPGGLTEIVAPLPPIAGSG